MIEVIAKVESHDSVPNIEEIVAASDAVMVARGDLGAHCHCCFWPVTPENASAWLLVFYPAHAS